LRGGDSGRERGTMTDLKRLKVSLTKHGSHKVAELLEKFAPNQVIANATGKVKGINIAPSQARKNLSALAGDVLPDFWNITKNSGRPAINAIVLLAIVFSHNELIKVMIGAIKGPGRGVVKRSDVDGGKGFTNFKDDFYELGFATSVSSEEFAFDISSIIGDKNLGLIARHLFKHKLLNAGWDEFTALADEAVSVGFHEALGLTEASFRAWISEDVQNLDELPEQKDAEATTSVPFLFKAGHKKRGTADVIKKGHGDTAKARQIHNDLMNKLYDHLCVKHGKDNVGTEITSGPSLTSIDLVLRVKSSYKFYEIKTSRSIRKCIREATPQLLEYAYWPDQDRAVELVIISANKSTKDAKSYLKKLRDKFKIPLYHETIDRKSGELSGRI
jgi:hypothetical protein